jgi:hypothetical protein
MNGKSRKEFRNRVWHAWREFASEEIHVGIGGIFATRHRKSSISHYSGNLGNDGRC